MGFKPLNDVIHHLKQHQWQEQQAFQRLLDEWPEIVGPEVAAQTEPTRITQQGVLQVATASGVWAHNLSFERQHILTKVNQRFHLNLTDIFFATSQWGQSSLNAYVPNRAEQPNSAYQGSRNLPPKKQHPDAKSAFESWAETIQARSQSLPVCPQCQCPTPEVEFERWGMCSLCDARNRLVSDRSNEDIPE